MSGSFFPLRVGPDPHPPQPYARPPLVAVYGDSFTDAGPLPWLTTGLSWVEMAGRALGVDTANMAVGGSGYVQCPDRSTFPHEVITRPVRDADVVVIFGGFNDRVTTASSAVGVAAAVTFAAARLTMPAAALMVIGPQWPDGGPPDHMWRHRDEVRAAAHAAGARWVDPLEERWFADRPDLIWGDHIHPNDAGHRHLADLIAPHIAAALGRKP